MRVVGVLFTWLLLACVAVLPARADDVDVQAGFEVDDALLGDTVGFTILVNGTDDVQAPADDEFGFDFDVHFLGGRPSRRSSIVTVNGRTTRREEVSYALMYEFRPRRAGNLRVPPLLLRAAGVERRTPERVLRVIGPRESRFARLDLEVSPRRVHVEQPVELVLRVTVQQAQMPSGWYEGDPWLPGRSPQLRIPWFERLDGFLTGDFDAYRRSLLAEPGASGFLINGESQSSLFGDVRALRFRLARESVIQDGRAYNVYTLRKELIPLRPGRVDVPVSSLTGELATVLQEARGQLEVKETETVFVAHDPVVIDVLPVPEEGRPPTYTHAVGRFEAVADATPRRVKVGDPMTLILALNGSGLLDRVDAPDLAAQADLAADFLVAESDPPRTEGGRRIFTYQLRPRHEHVTAVPPLQVAMFDPESATFRTVTTDALPVTVEESRAVQASEVVVAGGGPAAVSTPGEELHGGLLGNFSDQESLVDESFAPQRSAAVWLLLLAPPLLFVGVAIAAHRRDALAADPAGRRARGALSRALENVAAGQRALQAADRGTAAAKLHEALAGYVADRVNRPAAGMTAADVGNVLAEHGVDVPAAAEIVAALRDAEAARFGGSPAQVADALDASPGWLRALEAEGLS